jgi:hypothetical protein
MVSGVRRFTPDAARPYLSPDVVKDYAVLHPQVLAEVYLSNSDALELVCGIYDDCDLRMILRRHLENHITLRLAEDADAAAST